MLTSRLILIAGILLACVAYILIRYWRSLSTHKQFETALVEKREELEKIKRAYRKPKKAK